MDAYVLSVPDVAELLHPTFREIDDNKIEICYTPSKQQGQTIRASKYANLACGRKRNIVCPRLPLCSRSF